MHKGNFINTKKLSESSVRILENIFNISQEVKSCEITTNKIIEYCKELDSYDGRKIIFSTDIPTLDLSTSDEWYRLYVLGHEELIEYTINLKKKLEDIQYIMSSIFDKIKSVDSSTDIIDSQIDKVKNILINGTETSTVVTGIQNLPKTNVENSITNETFIESVKTNFEQNKILNNHMNQEIYKGIFEKMKDFSSNYRGGNS